MSQGHAPPPGRGTRPGAGPLLSVVACLLLLAVFLIRSATAAEPHGAPFPPISPAERAFERMPGDPPELTPVAVILFEESTVDDRAAGGRSQDVHRRLKILTPGGVSRARTALTLVAGVQRLVRFEGRTVRSDGTESPLDAAGITRRTTGGREEIDIRFPDAVPGSIVEYRYRIEGGPVPDQAGWIFQHDVPTLRSTFVWHPGFGRTSHWALLKAEGLDPRVEPVTAPERPDSLLAARFELRNLAAIPDEPWGPPALETRARLVTTYTDLPMAADDYWTAYLQYQREAVAAFTSDRTALAARLRAAGPPPDGFDARVRRAYEFAQSAITNVEIAGEPAPPLPGTADSLLALGHAGGEGVDLVFLAALAEYGIAAERAWVVDRDQGFFHREVPWAGQFSRSLVAVRGGEGQVVFFSPGTPFAPPGVLPWYTQGITALLSGDSGYQLAPTPVDPAGVNRIARRFTLELELDGTVEGTVEIDFSGQPEMEARLRYPAAALESLRERVAREWQKSLERVRVDSLRILHAERADRNLGLRARLSLPEFAPDVDRGRILNLALLSRELRDPFAAPQRAQPVFVPYPRTVVDNVRLRLGSDWKPASVPERIEFENEAGFYRAFWAYDGEDIVYQRSFGLTATKLEAKGARALSALYRQAIAGDGTLVALSRIVLPPSRRKER